jgi:hypothetical protein
LVMLPGCLRVPTYTAKPMNVLNDNFTYHAVKKGVVFQAKRLTLDEINYLFDERAKGLLGSTEIIYCSIPNISNQDYVLSLQNEDFLPLRVHEVKRLMKTNSGKRLELVPVFLVAGTAIGLSAIGMATLALAGAPLLGFPYFFQWWYVGIWALGLGHVNYGGRLLSGISLLACVTVPLVYFGKSIVMNSRISRDLKEKMLQGNELIKSGEVGQGLIFIRTADYKPQLSITMHEKNNSKNKIVFDVDLLQKSRTKREDNVLPYYADLEQYE